MKKKRILLGVSSVILAVAGIFATKATTKDILGHYQTTAGCHFIWSICPGVAGTMQCKTNVVGIGLKTIFTSVTTVQLKKCQNPWKYGL